MNSELQQIRKIDLNGQMVSYRVRVSLRAKRVRLEISRDNGLLVVVPKRFPAANVANVVRTKSDWILRKLVHFATVQDQPPTSATNDGDEILYQGRLLKLHVSMQPVSRVKVIHQDNSLRIVMKSSTGEELESVLEEWYRRQARQVVMRRVEYFSRLFKVSYSRVFIRNQRTRWGSCSTRGNLNFNWRLVMMPPDVMDYIIIHELTHLNEPNHSRQFWQLVETRCSHYKKHKAWLKKNGPALMG